MPTPAHSAELELLATTPLQQCGALRQQKPAAHATVLPDRAVETPEHSTPPLHRRAGRRSASSSRGNNSRRRTPAWLDEAPAADYLQVVRDDAAAGGRTTGPPAAPGIIRLDWTHAAKPSGAMHRLRLVPNAQQYRIRRPAMPTDWLIIGEAPGRMRINKGGPFRRPTGKLLDNMLAAIGSAAPRQ